MNDVYEWTPDGPRSLAALLDVLAVQRAAGATLVTTNGCFDLLHAGHAAFLNAARAQGDLLVVGLNSDASVRQLKGAGRPITSESDRAALLAALRAVDHVVVFDAPTPEALLEQLQPDIHCKAGDYTVESLPETATVRAGGGVVRILPLLDGRSTSRIVARALAHDDAAASTANAGPLELMLDSANLVRQTGYALREQLGAVASMVRVALAQGNNVTVCGNRASGAIVAAAGLDYRVYLPPGKRGDLIFVVLADDTPEELPRVVTAAQARGITAIALLGAAPSPIDAIADMCLRVPSADPARTRLAMVAALRTIGEMAGAV